MGRIDPAQWSQGAAGHILIVSIAPFTAQTIETYQAQTAIAVPAAGTPAIFRATAVHLLTAEHRAAEVAALYGQAHTRVIRL